MNAKERFNITIEGGKADRLPVVTHHIMEYFLKNVLGDVSVHEFFEKFKIDEMQWFDAIDSAENDDWKIQTQNIEGTQYKTARHTIITPKGKLTMVMQGNAYTSWASEHLIKNDRDIELLEYFPKKTANVELINSTLKDDTIYRGTIPGFDFFGQPGCWQDAACLYGIENLIMKTYDDPKWVHEFLKRLQAYKLDYINSLNNANYDIIELGGGDASSTVISPKIFDEFVAPYDSKLIEAAHQNGQKIVYHTCGGMMPILENILSMKPDAMETFTPIDMGGDVDLAKASKVINGRACMIGGFDQGHFFKGCTPDDTRREVRRCFEEAGENGGYILSPSDHFFDADVELLEAFADEAMKCVY